jgi:hypothetical protein
MFHILATRSGCLITFSEAIDPASFTASEIIIRSPAGAISARGEPVPTADPKVFSILLAPAQIIAGTYALTITTGVLDLAGNPLNQDNDAMNGETNDSYISQFQIAPAAPRPFPYEQGFESSDLPQRRPARRRPRCKCPICLARQPPKRPRATTLLRPDGIWRGTRWRAIRDSAIHTRSSLTSSARSIRARPRSAPGRWIRSGIRDVGYADLTGRDE